jgi:hypothetical protein
METEMANGMKIKLYKKVVGGTDGSQPKVLRGLFTVYVINRSAWDIAYWKVGDDPNWYKLDPPIGTNCDSDCDDCWTQGHYSMIHSFPSSADPFDLHLKARQGDEYRDYLIHIKPTPTTDGIALCLPIPT